MKNSYKKIISVVLTIIILLTAAPMSGFVGLKLNLDWLNFDWLDFSTKSSALDTTGQCGDNVHWTFDESTGTLTISGTGNMYDYDNESPFYNNSSIKNVVIEAGVTSIGNSAFYNCTGLTSVTIPDSVTSIGYSAFSNCTILTSISIPDSVELIGYAFYNTAYYNDLSNWENDVLYISNHLIAAKSTVSGDYTIKIGTKCIADSAFFECTGLTSITIPDSVISICDEAFLFCRNLTKVKMGNSVENIGAEAFSNCTNLKSITIPNSVKIIGNYAFLCCEKLMSSYIGRSVSNIGYEAFDCCDSLKFFAVDNNNAYFSNDENGVLFNKEKTELICFPSANGCTSYIIPNSVTSIREFAFRRSSLLSITIPDSVTCIGEYAFASCEGLKSLNIPDSVTNIGVSAFSCCTGLTSIIVPDSVVRIGSCAFDRTGYFNDSENWENGVLYIGNLLVDVNSSVPSDYIIKPGTRCIADYAFSGCPNLTKLTILDSVTYVGECSFYNCTSLKNLSLPCSTKIYKNAFLNCENIESLTLTKGNGTMQNYGTSDSISTLRTYYQYTPWYISRDKIKEINLEDGIETIGSYAFYECTGITSVTIPESVSSIGDSAFRNCTGLIDIMIPDSVTNIGIFAISGCTGLMSATIPDSVITISNYLFSGCTELKSISFSKNVTSIGNYAFRDCSKLTNITIPYGVKSVGHSSFSGCNRLENIIIPESITNIGNYAFRSCTGIKRFTIPDSVMSIGSNAFSNCSSDINFYCYPDSYGETFVKNKNYIYWLIINNEDEPIISENITNKLNYVLNKCTRTLIVNCDGRMPSFQTQNAPWIQYNHFIEHIIVNDGCTTIGYNAFKSLQFADICLPSSLLAIDQYAFSDCISLTNLTIPDSVTIIGNRAFYNCTELKELTIPCSVSVSDSFYNCKRIERVHLTVGTGLMNNYSSYWSTPWYYSRNNLKTIILDEGIKSIGNYAFYECASSFSIPITVTKIGNYAFYGCLEMNDIIISNFVESIGSYSFANAKTIKIYNNNCLIGVDAIPYTATIYGYSNSTAEDFANQYGYTFEYLNEDHEHLYDNNCDANCNICGKKRIVFHADENFNGVCDNCGKTLLNILPGTSAIVTAPAGEIGYLKYIPSQSGIYRFYSTGSADTYGYICNADKSIIASDNNSGNNNNFSVSATLKANTVYFLGAKYLDTNTSGTISVTLVCDQVVCEHASTHKEHRDSTCTADGYTKIICDVCGQTITETVYPASHHYAWVTIRNATTTEEGLAQKKCTACGYVAEEFTIPVMVADFVTGITISPKKIALNVGETADIVTVITPDTATNKNIIWSSTDSENAAVSGGTVTAVRPGTSVIIAETEDGGYRDFCQVRVISLTASNGAVVNSESGLVYGLAPKLGSIDGYIDTVDESISAVCEDSVIGTGSVIQIVRDGELIDSYKAVIFGDVNSDGVYDAQDAFIVNCIANGLLSRDQVGEAKFLAADCNHDGEVNSSDVLILEQAGLLLSKVEQAKDEEMKEQALGEYLDLIDQNSEINEADEATEEKTASIFDRIIDFVKKIIDFLKSILAKF